MSYTNTRNSILEAVKTVLAAVASIKKATRQLVNDFSELESVADTLVPYCAVTAELPKPAPHKPGRVKNIWADNFEDLLKINIICYYRETVNYTLDEVKGSLYDDIFRALNVDQTLGGRVHYFEIEPEVPELVARPYGAFKITLNVKYFHGIGGI